MKETDSFKADKDLLTRLPLVARTWRFDYGEILTHCLLQFLSSLSNRDSSLLRTNKASLLNYLQAKFPDIKIIKIPQNTTLILDGIAIIQQLADHVPATFGDLNIYIFRYMIKLASFYMPPRVDFVCDKYNPVSIKDSKRRRRSISLVYLLCALNPVSEILHVWQKISRSIYGDALEENSTRKIQWKNCVCFIESMMFHVSSKWYKWSDHRNFARIIYWSWGSRCPCLASCKPCISCFPFHYHQDSRYSCFSFLPCSTEWIKCWLVCGN